MPRYDTTTARYREVLALELKRPRFCAAPMRVAALG